MADTCSSCGPEFQSAAGVTQHVALYHNTCAECNEYFGEEATATYGGTQIRCFGPLG